LLQIGGFRTLDLICLRILARDGPCAPAWLEAVVSVFWDAFGFGLQPERCWKWDSWRWCGEVNSRDREEFRDEFKRRCERRETYEPWLLWLFLLQFRLPLAFEQLAVFVSLETLFMLFRRREKPGLAWRTEVRFFDLRWVRFLDLFFFSDSISAADPGFSAPASSRSSFSEYRGFGTWYFACFCARIRLFMFRILSR
jgi:hypothetical protein